MIVVIVFLIIVLQQHFLLTIMYYCTVINQRKILDEKPSNLFNLFFKVSLLFLTKIPYIS